MPHLVKYSHFVNGIDRSQGRFVEDYRLLYEADNVVFTNGRRIKARPPVRRLDVALDSQTQGLAHTDCGLRVLAANGDDIAHTGEDAGEIDTLYFDVPDYCGPRWELLHLSNYQNRVEAWIKHDFSGDGDVDHIVMKHTLDPSDGSRRKPTYCEDPWCPTNWNANGTRPLHLYGKGDIGRFVSSFTPASVAAAEKLCASRPNSDVAFSGTGASKVWNPFTLQDLLDFGLPYYFLIPDLEGETLFNFTVAEYHSDLDNDRAWAGYVLEYLDSDGRWQKITEVDDTPVDNITYHAQPIQSRFEEDRNELSIALRWGGDPNVWIRWRAVAGLAPIQVIDGGTLETEYTPDDWSAAGDDVTTQFTTDVDYDDFKLHYSTIIILDDLELNLILGSGMHYTITDDDGKGRIDFCTDSGDIYQLTDGVVENSYVTNLRWDTQRYVSAFAPTVWKDGDPTDVVDPADYTLSNADGYIRLTWDDNVPSVGTEWTIGFLPTSDDTVRSDATAVHYEAGSYLFEGVVWEFPAIKLSDIPTDSDIIAGIPHYPLFFGSGVGGTAGGGAVYTSAGTYNYTVPSGVTSLRISLWGAGGGGGGGDSQVVGVYRGEAAGGGGGGGEFHAEEIDVTPGDVLTITVGAGGAGGRSHCWTVSGGSCNRPPLTNGEDGEDGGDTFVQDGATTLLEVSGGSGGGGGVHDSGGAVGGSGGAGGFSSYQSGADGDAGDDRRHITGYGPWQDGGDGGASGAGDTYGRGGDGARAKVFDDGCVCSRYDPGDTGNDGRVLIEAQAGLKPWTVDPNAESMPLNGWVRYHMALKHRIVTDGTGAIVGSKAYHYGAESGHESQFYADRRAEYAELAGAEDAGYIASSTKEHACGTVVALSSLQNRLGVHFDNTTLLYQFGVDPEANAPLDELHFGSQGVAVPFYSGTMLLTQQSFRVFSLRGDNFDSLRDNNYGRPIEDLDVSAIHNAAYWPAIGAYVAIVTLDGDLRLVFFSFSWEEKVRAWTLGTVRDFLTIPSVDSMWAVGPRLYFRYGNLVRYLDANATEFIDDVDEDLYDAAVAADPGATIYKDDYKYVSMVRFQPNDLQDPRRIKKWRGIDVECGGRCQAWMYETTEATAHRTKGPTFTGASLNRRRIPLILRSYSLSVELVSDDVDGWELDSMYLQVDTARR